MTKAVSCPAGPIAVGGKMDSPEFWCEIITFRTLKKQFDMIQFSQLNNAIPHLHVSPRTLSFHPPVTSQDLLKPDPLFQRNGASKMNVAYIFSLVRNHSSGPAGFVDELVTLTSHRGIALKLFFLHTHTYTRARTR